MFTIPISFLLKALNIYGPSPSSVVQIGTTWRSTNIKACKMKILYRNDMLVVYHIFPVIVWMAETVLPLIREVIQYSWTVCADRYGPRVGVSHSQMYVNMMKNIFICAVHVSCVMLQGTLESMMKCAEDQCPHVLADDRVQGQIRKMCREKNFLAPEFIHTCIVEQAGADIMNKFRLVCDRVGSLHKHHSEILSTLIYSYVLS